MKIEKKIENIDLKKIDIEDEIFLYSSNMPIDEKLKASIKNLGILNPVVLQKKGSDNYRIVCGKKRINIGREFDFETVPAYIFLELDNNAVNIFLMSIEENSSFRSLNEIEKGRIIFKLLNKFKADDAILMKVCEILGIAFSEHNIQKYLAIASLPFDLQLEILNLRLSWDTAVNLMKFRTEDRLNIFKIIKELRMNVNIAKEVVENLKDLMKNGGIISDVLVKILEFIDQDINNKEKVGAVRDILAKNRFPNLYEKEQKFLEMKKKLEIDEVINLSHFPFFEREEYCLTVNFKDIDELKDLKKQINRIQI
jgi:ParB family chromosome partitioning protein